MALAIAIIAISGLGLFVDGSSAHNTRIFGGESVSIENYPYQISMRWTYGVAKPMHFCGGAIIDKSHVVTAAHCVMDKRSPQMLQYVRIYTGTSRSDTGRNAYAVKAVSIHPGYRGASNTYLNDIAVVTLRTPIEFDESQQPIKLASRDIQSGSSAVITGWGSTDPTQRTPANLQKATMRLISSTECRSSLPFNLSYSQVCAINRPGIGVCSGDSGGPLVANGELIGVASYVVKCAEGKPDVYTNVYSFVNFVKQATLAYN